MPRIAVLGATGPVGRRATAALAAGGHDLVLVGRDDARLRAVATDLDADRAGRVVVRTLDADASLAALRDAVRGSGVAVSALPALDGLADRAVAAAIAEQVPLVATSDHPGHLQRTFDEFDAPARAAGTVIVPGTGWRTTTADLLAAVAAERVLGPRAVHAAAVVPDRGGVLRAATPGQQRERAACLGQPMAVVRHGRRTEELVGEERRLAWFPRPYGPHHAAGVAGLEALSVPRHLPGVETVRSYAAVSSMRAEALQAAANLARWPVARRRFARRLELRARRWQPTPSRWAVVVEVAGEDGLARGWMNGHDTLEATALLVTVTVDAVLHAGVAPGVRAPAELGRAHDLLDRVAAVSSIRWAVSRPAG